MVDIRISTILFLYLPGYRKQKETATDGILRLFPFGFEVLFDYLVGLGAHPEDICALFKI